jgi:hypothetical protein
MFITLVGPASLGKGMVIGPVKSLLKDHEYHEVYDTGTFKTFDPKIEEVESNTKNDNPNSFEDSALFPTPAESSSLRALTHYMSVNSRCCYYIDSVTKKKRCYLQAACFLILEELVSLLKSGKETVNMVDYLVQVWDAGDYKHMTFGYGIDPIKNSCVCILAGTTPDSMERLFTENLLREGVSARTLFIYEEEKRFLRWPMGGIKPSQTLALRQLRNHMWNLSRLCGEVKFTPEAEAHMKDWYEKTSIEDRANYNVKLDPYYGRKKVHLMKLACAIHFTDSLELLINDIDVQLAMDLIKALEVNMHKALRSKVRNELATESRKVLTYLKTAGPTSIIKLWMDFYESFKNMDELKQTIAGLKTMEKIEEVAGNPMKYKLKGK